MAGLSKNWVTVKGGQCHRQSVAPCKVRGSCLDVLGGSSWVDERELARGVETCDALGVPMEALGDLDQPTCLDGLDGPDGGWACFEGDWACL